MEILRHYGCFNQFSKDISVIMACLHTENILFTGNLVFRFWPYLSI